VTPVNSAIFSASSKDLISPLAITGHCRLSLIIFIASKLTGCALCSFVLPCTVIQGQNPIRGLIEVKFHIMITFFLNQPCRGDLPLRCDKKAGKALLRVYHQCFPWLIIRSS
jgi:hypothetical protein